MTDVQARPTQGLGALEPTQPDLELPMPPEFDNVEDERLHRKQRLAAGLRVLGRLRLAEGVAGHVTVRDPEYPDHFWVNPFGKNFKHMKVSDLICVNHEGTVVEGNKPVNTAAFVIHGAIHHARPDVIAAAHCHSMYGRTFSSLGKPLRMITQDSTAFYGDVAMHAEDSGAPVLSADAGARMAASLGDKKVMIHQNHGLISTGGSVDAAVWNFVALDRCCQSQLLAESAGDPIEVTEELCIQGRETQGTDFGAWFQFQPWWDELMLEEPDFLN